MPDYNSPVPLSLTRCLLLITLTLFALPAVTPLLAQTRYLVDAPGTWKAWKFTATAEARKEQAAPAALVKAVEAELVALSAVLRQAPGVASPRGFSVETSGSLPGYSTSASGQPAAARLPVSSTLSFGAFSIYEYDQGGKVVRKDTGETALLQLHVNQLQSWLLRRGGVLEWASVDTNAFLQPLPAGEIAGFPRFGDVLVVKKNPAPLWTPLPLGTALDLVATARRAVLAGEHESVGRFEEALAKVRDPARRAERMKDVTAAAANMPNPAAFIAQMEEALRVEETAILEALGPKGSSTRTLAEAQAALDDVTAWLEALTPAERSEPACYSAAGNSLRTRFRTSPGPGCVPLVSPNYEFFDKSLPRSAPQVLIVTPIERCFNTADKYNQEANSELPAGCPANRRLVETVDRDALLAWLR